MLNLHDLAKRFGSLTAVAGVTLEIQAGEAFGLLGPNGAGKTTLISMMMGIIQPDSGQVEIRGLGPPSDPEVRRSLGYSPQSLAIYTMLTAEENLRFFGALYGLRGAQLRERVSWGLAFAGLEERATDRAGNFSGGMQRRLNLACALLHQPKLLLLDEPTVGVDPQSRNLIFDRIEELKAHGMTLLYTTHYMEEAARLCDRIAIMDRGRILALDSLEGLIQTHGGQSRVIFDLDQPAEPPMPEGASVRGNRVVIPSSDPVRTINDMAATGSRILGVRTDRPTLEDVFLQLTGRTLRD